MDQLHVMKFRPAVQEGAEERAWHSAAGVEVDTVSALDQPDGLSGRRCLLGRRHMLIRFGGDEHALLTDVSGASNNARAEARPTAITIAATPELGDG